MTLMQMGFARVPGGIVTIPSQIARDPTVSALTPRVRGSLLPLDIGRLTE